MPEATLKPFADRGNVRAAIPILGVDSEAILRQFADAGVRVDALAAQLQEQGANSFIKSWNDLLEVILSKSAALRDAA
jgi:transaldolase